MKTMTDFYFINAYKKGDDTFVVFTDKRDKKAYSVSKALLTYILEHPKDVKKEEK